MRDKEESQSATHTVDCLRRMAMVALERALQAAADVDGGPQALGLATHATAKVRLMPWQERKTRAMNPKKVAFSGT